MKNFENVYKELENLFINKLPEYEEDKTIHLWRYIEAINKMLLEEKSEDIEYSRITKMQGTKVFIKLVI